jgi:transposase
MSERILKLMDIRELILHIRNQSSDRQIQRDTGIDRRTVKRYREWALEQGLLEGDMPPLETLQALVASSFQEKTPPQNLSSLESYRRPVKKWVDQGVEIAAIRQRLLERGYTGSYASVWRFVRTIKPSSRKGTTTRVETKPGEEAQVDFGYAGRMVDPRTGKLRKAWAFVMTLSWSRHQYVEFVWDQKVETWLNCHRKAFEFFAGTPGRVRIDNLKTAVFVN